MGRDGCAALVCKTPCAGPVRHGQDARCDRGGDTGIGAGIAEPQETVRLKEELGDRLAGTRIHLGLEPVYVLSRGRGIGVPLRVGANTDIERPAARQRRDQLDGIGKPVRSRRKGRAICAIAPQRNQVRDARRQIPLGRAQHIITALAGAGQMRGDRQARRLAQRLCGLLGQPLGRAPRAIGDRDKAGRKRGQCTHRVPQMEGRIE